MLNPDDLMTYELCIPGSVTGSTEIKRPHSGAPLTARVNDPTGEDAYQCGEYSGTFEDDWGEGQVRYDSQ